MNGYRWLWSVLYPQIKRHNSFSITSSHCLISTSQLRLFAHCRHPHTLIMIIRIYLKLSFWRFICLFLWRKENIEALRIEKNQISFVIEEVKETKLGGSHLEPSKLDNVSLRWRNNTVSQSSTFHSLIMSREHCFKAWHYTGSAFSRTQNLWYQKQMKGRMWLCEMKHSTHVYF